MTARLLWVGVAVFWLCDVNLAAPAPMNNNWPAFPLEMYNQAHNGHHLDHTSKHNRDHNSDVHNIYRNSPAQDYSFDTNPVYNFDQLSHYPESYHDTSPSIFQQEPGQYLDFGHYPTTYYHEANVGEHPHLTYGSEYIEPTFYPYLEDLRITNENADADGLSHMYPSNSSQNGGLLEDLVRHHTEGGESVSRQHLSNDADVHSGRVEHGQNAISGIDWIHGREMPYHGLNLIDHFQKGGIYRPRLHDKKGKGSDSESYFSLSPFQKNVLIHRLHLYTGFLRENIANRLRKTLKEDDLFKILSGDPTLISSAVMSLFSGTLEISHGQRWMEGMSMDDSITVVKKLLSVLDSQKDEEHLRNYFLRNLGRRRAQAIFSGNEADCKMIAMEMGLDKPNNRIVKRGSTLGISKTIEVWPWMSGLTDMSKSRIIQRMIDAGFCEKVECYHLLQRGSAHGEDYGRSLLQMPIDQLAQVVHDLRNTKA
jgi:hypothetical protein